MDTIPQNTPQKQCKDCKQFFPATIQFFHTAKVNTDGLLSQCKECRSKYMSTRYALQHPQPAKQTPPPGQKFCIKCGDPKPVDGKHFKPKANGRDGFHNVCRECMNQQDTERTHKRHQETPPTFCEDVLKECTGCHNPYPATPQYFHLNKRKPDGLDIQCKTCHKTRSKEYNLKNPDKVQEQKFLYREANREALRVKGRAYLRANRAAQNARFRKRYNQLKQNGGELTARDIQQQHQVQQGKCYWCKSPLDKYHVDHIIPVSQGGPDTPENIVLTCPFCNQSRGTKPMEEWLLYLEKFILTRLP